MDTWYFGIAYAIQAEEGLIEQVINGYGLFAVENEKFYSKSLKERMKEMDRKREQQRQKAFMRWGKEKENDGEKDTFTNECPGNATALPNICHKIIEEKSRGEKNKEEKKRSQERGDPKEREGVTIFPKWLPEKEMIDFFFRVHAIKDKYVFFTSFFYTIGSLPKTVWKNDVELKNSITKHFGVIISEIETIDIWETCGYIGKYGYGMSPEMVKSIVNNLKKNPKPKEHIIKYFFETAVEKYSPTVIMRNITNYLTEKKSKQN